jgi:uncharacterized coiled-coil protein SlyX
MVSKCEICKNLFSTKSALNKHQKYAKYCLDKKQELIKYSEKCACGEILINPQFLKNQTEKCIQYNYNTILNDKIVLENKIKTLNETISFQRQNIKELQDKLAKKPTTINNTINLQPLTSDWLNEKAKLISLKHVDQGAIGCAKFASEHSLKDRVKCLDVPRKKLQYIETDGAIIIDNKGNRISKLFFESIIPQIQPIINVKISDMELKLNETENIDEKLIILQRLNDLNILLKKVKMLSSGEPDILKDDFVRELCNLLPK